MIVRSSEFHLRYLALQDSSKYIPPLCCQSTCSSYLITQPISNQHESTNQITIIQEFLNPQIHIETLEINLCFRSADELVNNFYLGSYSTGQQLNFLHPRSYAEMVLSTFPTGHQHVFDFLSLSSTTSSLRDLVKLCSAKYCFEI